MNVLELLDTVRDKTILLNILHRFSQPTLLLIRLLLRQYFGPSCLLICPERLRILQSRGHQGRSLLKGHYKLTHLSKLWPGQTQPFCLIEPCIERELHAFRSRSSDRNRLAHDALNLLQCGLGEMNLACLGGLFELFRIACPDNGHIDPRLG